MRPFGLPGPKQLSAPDDRFSRLLDPRAELMAVLCYLAGYPEYAHKPASAYKDAVSACFMPFSGHEAVQQLVRFRQEHGIACNAPMRLAMHLDPLSLEARLPWEPFPERLDRRWSQVPLADFVDSLIDIRKQSAFDEFFQSMRLSTSSNYRKPSIIPTRQALISGCRTILALLTTSA